MPAARTLLTFLALLAVLVPLPGCGDDDGSGAGNGAAADDSDPDGGFDNTELVGDAGLKLDGGPSAPVSRLPGGDTVAFDACMHSGL
ncbi:MAG: hypothetical protein OXT09_05150 [Myxococcales bacterium]|nr:hypothetical protein [Myxococcales bacterium]